MSESQRPGSEDQRVLGTGTDPDGLTVLGGICALVALVLLPDVLGEIYGGLLTRGLGRDSTLFQSAAIGAIAALVGIIFLANARRSSIRPLLLSICVVVGLPHACVSGLDKGIDEVRESIKISAKRAEAPGIAACEEQAVSFNNGPIQAEGYLRETQPPHRISADQIRHRLVREGFQYIEELAPESPSGDFRDLVPGSGRYIRYELSASGDAACEAFYHDESVSLSIRNGDQYVPRDLGLRSAHWPGVPRELCIAATRTDEVQARVVIRREDFELDNGVKGWRTTVSDADRNIVAEEKSFVISESPTGGSGRPIKACQHLNPEVMAPPNKSKLGRSLFLDPDGVIEPAVTRAFTSARELKADSPVRRFYAWADAREGVDAASIGSVSKKQHVVAEITRTTDLEETISIAEFNKRYPNPSNTLFGSVYSRGETIYIHDERAVVRVTLPGEPGISYWGGVQWAIRGDSGLLLVSGLHVIDRRQASRGKNASASFRVVGIDNTGLIKANVLVEIGPHFWHSLYERKPILDASLDPAGLRVRFLDLQDKTWQQPKHIRLKQEVEVVVPMEFDFAESK